MKVLFILVALSLMVASGFLFAFFVAVRKGQFDDSYTPSIRILFDNKVKEPKTINNNKNLNDYAD